MFRPIEQMQVVEVDAVRRRLICQLQSGHIPGIPVRMGHDGPADALRVRQTPMPTIGTWGLVAFAGGDSRTGVWLKSVYTSDVDAYTGDGDPHTDFESDWSGAYRLVDGNGQMFGGLPDGTYWSHSVTPGQPALVRHVVDSGQNRVAQAVTPAQMVTTPPSARPFRYHHASGTQIDIAADGHVVIQACGTTLTIAANGAVTVNLAGGETFGVSDGGSIADALALVSKLVTAFNNHTHQNSGGSGTGGVPTTPWTASTIQSALVKVQA